LDGGGLCDEGVEHQHEPAGDFVGLSPLELSNSF
jgi:hypothetical protein